MSDGLREIHYAILDVLKDWGEGTQFKLTELDAALPSPHAGQGELARRLRELRSRGGYEIPCRGTTYTVKSLTPGAKKASSDPVSGKLAAQIRLAAHGRCQMCGKTIEHDGIRLVIDHRVPREWGGLSEPENLWAVCEPCNISKRDFFATLPNDVMKRCMTPSEPVERIGELLKAFDGEPVPRYLLEVVGMDDEWTRRLRELRDLDWEVESVRVKGETGAAKFSYRLVKARPWPKDIRAAIAAAARKRGAKSL